MGNTEAVEKSYPVTCPACKKKNQAVYRASFFHDHNSLAGSDLELEKKQIQFEEQFSRFLHNRTKTECQYVCCHECVTLEIKKRMKFMPFGWKESINVPIIYEPIKEN